MTYASTTTVSVEKSRMEIEQLLRKAGATSFVAGWDQGYSAIQCIIKGRTVRFRVNMPLREEHKKDGRGRMRTGTQVTAAVEQAERSRWRALFLVIKAKLEAVEQGIETFEESFLANMVLPSGETMAEWAAVELDVVYTQGRMPTSLLALGPGA